MAQWTFTVPDNLATRVVNAIARIKNYQPTIDGQPNPETKAQFAKRMVREQVKRWVVDGEGHAGDQTAREAAESEISISE